MVALLNRLQTFEQFLATTSPRIGVFDVIIALVLAAILSFILGKIYVRYGTALSNRKKFSDNFMLLATTTTLIIMVVKSSLALSLGLVGALSIIRFRAAIKEPEELAFLFLVISIGLGLGANQIFVTVIAFTIICVLIMLRHFSKKKEDTQNLSLTITSNRSDKVTLKNITTILKKHCNAVHLKRFDIVDNLIEASFFVVLDSFDTLDEVRGDLERLSDSVKVTYLDRGYI